MQNAIDEVKEVPGLQSVASATVTPASSRRRASGYGDRVENSTPGSRVATVVAAGQRVDVVVAEVGAVVGARGTELDGEPHARAGRELVGVHPQAQPGVPAGLQDGAGLVGVERVRGRRLAEHVDPPGVRGAGGEHRRR